MNVYLPNLRLPSEYQEVEWIQSNGNQYINTGYIITAPKYDMDFEFVGGQSSSWIPMLGIRDNTVANYGSYLGLYINSGSLYVTPNYARFDPGTSSGLTISKNTKYNIVEDEGQFYIDGVYKSSCSTTNTYVGSSTKTLYIFAMNDYNGTVQYRGSMMKLYYFKLYNSGTIVRDFVPCYRKSDSVIGLYDLVNNQFYTNAGTGTFSKGNDVTMSELKNAYIGEYIPPYLCFTANTANSTVKLNKNGSPTAVTLETSTDGSTWTAYTIGTTITLSNIGDKVYRRNTSENDTGFSISGSNYYKFVMSGSIAASGDVTTLLNKNGTDTLSNYCFYLLFNGCTALTKAPSLSATTLANDCYESMFDGCRSLETLPNLPATKMKSYCYCTMFYNCSKIKLSTTQTGIYQTPYRIPTTGTGSGGDWSSLDSMFYATGGTFTGTPSINTTYYTSNTVV